MRRTILVAALIFASTAFAVAEDPMWEGLRLTEAMEQANKDFVEGARKQTDGDLRKGAAHGVRRGWEAFQRGDIDLAIRRFNQAALLDPENGSIYWGFALATHRRGDGLKVAERWFQEAYKRIPKEASLFSDHGRVLDESGDPSAAKGYFEKALAIDPNHLEAHIGMTRVFVQLGDKAGAEKHNAEITRLQKKA